MKTIIRYAFLKIARGNLFSRSLEISNCNYQDASIRLFWIRYFGVIYLLLNPEMNLSAQLTSSDSIAFQSLFQSPLFTKDSGSFYLFDTCKSTTQLYQQLQESVHFTNDDYYHSYQKIIIENELSALDKINLSFNAQYAKNPLSGYKQRNPVFALNFTLNGKQGKSFTTYTGSKAENGQYPKTAFLIISGSGDNPTTDMMRGENYGCVYCDVKEHLTGYGDVFIHIKPLQDIRSIIWNDKKLESEISPNPTLFVVPYLSTLDQRYGTNCVIESIALLKYLKSHYDRVLITGLSHGGYMAYFSQVEAQTDGLLYAGGLGYDEEEWTFEQQYFGRIMDLFYPDSMLQEMKSSSGLYYYSVAKDDMQPNIPSTFLGLSNVYFDLSKQWHSFPYCEVFDDWINRSLSKPKVHIDTFVSSQQALRLTFHGVPPFHFHWYANSTDLGEFTSDNNEYYIPIYYNATYQVRYCWDQLKEQESQSNTYVIGNLIYNFPFEDPMTTSAHIVIYNIVGSKLVVLPVDADRKPSTQAQAYVNHLGSGLYFYQVMDRNKIIDSGSLVPLFHN